MGKHFNARVVLFFFFVINWFLVSEAAAVFITDVNGDGIADVIVGAYLANPSSRTDAGSAYVYSGSNGALLYTFNGSVAGDWLGYSVAMAGDVNGDGRGDLIVGAPNADPSGHSNAGSVFVYSGATGALLYRFNGSAANDGLGSYVTAGDVDGDGRSDLIVTGGFSLTGGRVYVFSGATGALLYTFAPPSGEQFGPVAAGDVNGDGKADIIVGNPCGSCGIYDVIVYSGASGVALYKIDTGGESGAQSVSAGDFTCDGKADIIVGAEYEGATDNGMAYIYNGATGNLIRTHSGVVAYDHFGHSVSSAGNVDYSSCSDYIIGAPYFDPPGKTNAGAAYIYSGLDGTQNVRIDGGASYNYFGWSVSGAGGVTTSNTPAVIVGAPSASPGGRLGAGSAYVYITPAQFIWGLKYQFNGVAAADGLGISVSGAK
ncbi:MAG: FG-GAP repeat protein [Nitrospirae bacterium]|nr:FG-GAP repeat protein [Nitrospirota bacterium]